MGREVKRVPLDFDWPRGKVWDGFRMPDKFDEIPCPDCKDGYSPHAQYLQDLWYGYLPFDPASTGSTPFTADTPAVRASAERNVNWSPEYYGSGEGAIVREAQRLADLFNRQWSHHLSQEDVDALVARGRLMDFTHTWNPETRWQKIDPPVVPPAQQVNEWSLRGLGHDSLNAHVVITARCEREGVPDTCATCQGHGSLEAYEGQRTDVEAWEPTQPPTGDGWQLWSTVSQGSPVSPVFPTAEALAQWLTTPEGGENAGPSRKPMTISQARAFVDAGWSPTMIGTAGGLHDGAEYVGTQAVLDQITDPPEGGEPGNEPDEVDAGEAGTHPTGDQPDTNDNTSNENNLDENNLDENNLDEDTEERTIPMPTTTPRTSDQFDADETECLVRQSRRINRGR